MVSKVTGGFRDSLRHAPADIRKAAIDSYRMFRADPLNRRLGFSKVQGNIWRAEIKDTGWRVIGLRQGDTIIWDFLGDHSKYVHYLKTL